MIPIYSNDLLGEPLTEHPPDGAAMTWLVDDPMCHDENYATFTLGLLCLSLCHGGSSGSIDNRLLTGVVW